MRGPATATSSIRISAGSSPACGWRKACERGCGPGAARRPRLRRRCADRPFPTAKDGPGAVVLRSSGVGTVRGDHAASRILSDADRDRPAQAPRSRSGGACRAAGGGGVRLRLVAKDAAAPGSAGREDRKRVVEGKRLSVRLGLGGRRTIKKKK